MRLLLADLSEESLTAGAPLAGFGNTLDKTWQVCKYAAKCSCVCSGSVSRRDV